MKQLTYLSLAVLLVCTACTANVKTKLIGSWQLDTKGISKFAGNNADEDTKEDAKTENASKTPVIVGKWKPTDTKSKGGMEFRKDGSLKISNGKSTETATWEASKDKKSIKIVMESGKTERMVITKFKGNRLTFTDGKSDKEVTLQKVNTDSDVDDADKKNDRKIEKTIPKEGVLEFRKDETFLIVVGKTSINGKWEVAKDNKSVTLMPEKGVSETFTDIKVEGSEFKFRDGKTGDMMNFRKK